MEEDESGPNRFGGRILPLPRRDAIAPVAMDIVGEWWVVSESEESVGRGNQGAMGTGVNVGWWNGEW